MSDIIIVGCGRVGSRLALMLSEHDNNVCVIDRDPSAFAALGRDFNGSTFVGVGYDEEILVNAGIEECDFVAAVTQSDNANLMVVEIARRLYDVPHAVARLYDSSHERTYLQLGIDYVCGTTLVAEEIFSKAISGIGDHIATFGDFEVLQFALNLSEVGQKSIKVADLESRHGIRVCAFGKFHSFTFEHFVSRRCGARRGFSCDASRYRKVRTGLGGGAVYIVIVGGGKLGAYLAGTLLREDNQVALIEKCDAQARRLAETIDGSCLVVSGDGCSASVQEDAAMQSADVFVAATGQDEDNLAACEIASRVFDVPRCIARVNSPKNLRIFRRLGIESVSSTVMIANMIQEEAMLGSMGVAVSLSSDQIGLLDIKVPTMRNHDNYKGVRALDIKFDEGIRMIAVSHQDDVEVVNSETRIFPGDQVIVAADTDLLARAREIVRSL